MRCTVSMLRFSPFEMSRARAIPTSVPPRPYSLRQSRPRWASSRIASFGRGISRPHLRSDRNRRALNHQVIAAIQGRAVFHRARLVWRFNSVLDCGSVALHSGLEVTSQQSINIKFNVSIRSAREQLQVQLVFGLLNPALQRVFNEVQILLLSVRECAVRQVLQEYRRQAVDARDLLNAETLQFNQLHLLRVKADLLHFMAKR